MLCVCSVGRELLLAWGPVFLLNIHQQKKFRRMKSSMEKNQDQSFNPIALRKAKIVYNFGLSECNRIKGVP